MKLTKDEIDIVKTLLTTNGIQMKNLYDDLLDHICCFVEERASRRDEFETVLKQALDDVAPFGLKLVQHETTLLLTFGKPTFMNKLTFATGAICAMTFITGSSFILLGWLGGIQLMLAGFLGFVFLFLPLLTIQRYQRVIRHSWLEKTKYASGIVSGIFFSLSFVFKISHLPGADQFLVIATLVCVGGFLPVFFLSLYKNTYAS